MSHGCDIIISWAALLHESRLRVGGAKHEFSGIVAIGGESLALVLPQHIKDAATAAFRDNTNLAQMSPQEREVAALFYEQIAQQTVGTRAELARLYNLERARFLRGEVSQIASTAYQFGQEIGFPVTEQGSGNDI